MSGEMDALLWFVVLGPGILYAGLIGWFTYGWYRKRPVPAGSGNRAVSVVVAARDEAPLIADLLHDLAAQDYPKALMQVIVIDDRSADRTVETVQDFMKKNRSLPLVLLKTGDTAVSGKKAALNLGIAYATGEIILTTDADCRAGQGWVSALVRCFHDESIRMVCGPVKNTETRGFWNDFQSMEFAGLVASGAGATLAGRPFICNGANLAYRKEAFERVGGFEGNEQYLSGDDVFLLHKIKKAFGRNSIVFCKDRKALVNTLPAKGLRDFIRQRIRWASKSTGYRDAASVFTALVVFAYSLTVITSFLAGFFDPRFFIVSAGLSGVKMIADLPLMIGITGFTGQRKTLAMYPLFQVIYPLYVLIAGTGGFLGRRKW